MPNKKISLAIIQHNSEPGDYEENIKSVEKYLKQIKNENVQLVVLPELFATGYCANENIFKYEENEDGKTLNWMKEKARSYKIHIGGGIPIYSKGNLYNRFYIVSPSGNICGYAQKEFPEAYCFKRNEGIFSIDTELGKIGVSICADSHFTSAVKKLQNYDIDILLMPHAWPTLETGSQDETEFALRIVQLLKIPIAFANGIGEMEPMQGLMGKLMSPSKFKLRGKSCIINSNGIIVASLSSEAGFIMNEVELGKISNEKAKVPDFSGWIHDGSWLLRNIIIPFDIWRGEKIYKENLKKISRAE